ncbi:helix-turn-helix domain-containing protein [Paenibacillus xanthanilyticus]|uniref:Helix-turn-helix domain-containing protein n=1 Tax=Paenibacillus xanthanilyticus TaxID=1783531 RepID=A0ABV8KC58_9BACL
MKVRVVTKVDQLLVAKNMTQIKLAELTELRPSTISEIVRGTRSVINKDHIAKIAEVLGIEDISEIIELQITE